MRFSNPTPAALLTLLTAVLLTTAMFSQQQQQQRPTPVKSSHVTIFDLDSKSAREVYSADKMVEAPNWSPDGKYLLINSGGDLWQLPVAGGSSTQPEKLNLGEISRCNNDKGYSPDGKLIAFSSSAKAKGSQVYTVAASGGTPTLIVPETPSYFHGFSPDGRWMAIVSQRNGNFDLFRVPTQGGAQERLTESAGYDDGPDYSPDGKWIYFNSNRSGTWQIWRMPAGGAGPNDSRAEQVTDDEGENWFPHCSPNGKWVLFLTFPKGTATHNGHSEVRVRMIPMPGKKIRHEKIETVTTFFGGQGTINVNSWSPDSTKFAYVRYEQ